MNEEEREQLRLLEILKTHNTFSNNTKKKEPDTKVPSKKQKVIIDLVEDEEDELVDLLKQSHPPSDQELELEDLLREDTTKSKKEEDVELEDLLKD